MHHTLTLSAEADEQIRHAITRPLLEFNTAQAGPSGHQPLVVAIRNGEDEVIGGLWGATAYGWLYIQLLLVPEALRTQGTGRAVMHQAEQEALRRGCQHAWVDTQFGALGFYERLGYRVFGQLPDYPPGFTRSFLTKDLHAPPAQP